MTAFHAVILLTHWDQVIHIFVSELGHHCSDNGLLPYRLQPIISTNPALLLIGPLGTFQWIQQFSYKKINLKMSSRKWRPFYLSLNSITSHFCIDSNTGHFNSLWPGDAIWCLMTWLSFVHIKACDLLGAKLLPYWSKLTYYQLHPWIPRNKPRVKNSENFPTANLSKKKQPRNHIVFPPKSYICGIDLKAQMQRNGFMNAKKGASHMVDNYAIIQFINSWKHGCKIITVATDVLVLKHQAISIHSTDLVFIVLPKIHKTIHLMQITQEKSKKLWFKQA